MGVVLDENQVPDLDDLRVVFVDQLDAGFDRTLFVRAHVVVQLGARTARAGVAHHPEVVLRPAVHDVLMRNGRLASPEAGSFFVGLETQFLIALVHRGVHAGRIQTPFFREQLPGPTNSFFLEVISERPIAQHLKEGVVIRVVPHLVEVVVLT